MNTMVKIIFSIIFTFPLILKAQQTHVVGPKETLFSIGRDYKVHPRELAEYNNIPFEVGLTIGQVIKIPTKKTMQPVSNSTSSNNQPIAETGNNKPNSSRFVPIYHIVKKQENLFQIRMQYNKVPMDSLKKWNNLNSDGVDEGMNLIVGYKKIANETVSTNDNTNTDKARNNYLNNKENTNQKRDLDYINKKANELEKDKTISYAESIQDKNNASINNGGFFKSGFENQSSGKGQFFEESGWAASFKSTSGWDDGKYYCLYNNAPSGTIIKITNANNDKYIYAKVLDSMPDLEQNKGILIRLSKAATEQLGVSAEKFEAQINY